MDQQTGPTEPATAARKSLAQRIKARLKALKIELHAMALAFRHKRTPWYAKALLVLALAYAASPIDLIPDFIPVLGALDDLIVISAILWLAVRLIPDDVLAECRQIAREFDEAGGLTALLRDKFRDERE